MKKQSKQKQFNTTEYKQYKQTIKRNINLKLSFALIFSFICFASFVLTIVYLIFIIKNL